MFDVELRSKVNRIWEAFWSGGIANSAEVIAQITYLLCIRRLDEIHIREERRLDAVFPSLQHRAFRGEL